MSAPIDWSGLRAHWGRRACRLPGAAPALDPFRAYALVRRAAQPFRAGTRFLALPDVRFYVDGGWMRAPGDLLPGAEDADPAGYAQRVRARLDGRRFQLRVTQPLFLDYELWAQARAALAGLFAQVGQPSLALTATLWLGDADAATRGPQVEPAAASLRLPLLGGCLARCRRTRPRAAGAAGRTLCADAGEALYWPAGHWVEEADRGTTLGLAVSIPVGGEEAAVAVKDLLADLVDAELGAQAEVAMLDYPPRARGRDAIAPLRAVAAQMRSAVAGGALERALRASWAARASAAGLEPPPPPRADDALRPDDRVRLDRRSPLLRLAEGAQEWWAVNGHVFSVPVHPRAQALWRALHEPAAATVAQLCAGPRRRIDPGALALLQRLHDLRALQCERASA